MMVSRKSALILLIALFGFLAVLLFENESISAGLTFSKASGFYEEAFELELYAPPGTKIYYTLS